MNIFVSYHHKEADHLRQLIEEMISQTDFVSSSVRIGEIDTKEKDDDIKGFIRNNHISKADLIVVILTEQAWSRLFVDWEIFAGFTNNLPIMGLIAPNNGHGNENTKLGFDPLHKSNFPPRLMDNVDLQVTRIFPWPEKSIDFYAFAKLAAESHSPEKVNNKRALYQINIPLNTSVVDVESLSIEHEPTDWTYLESLSGKFPLHRQSEYRLDHIPLGKFLEPEKRQAYAQGTKEIVLNYLSVPSVENQIKHREEVVALWMKLINHDYVEYVQSHVMQKEGRGHQVFDADIRVWGTEFTDVNNSKNYIDRFNEHINSLMLK